MFEFYSAKIRLNGKIENEVFKPELTAPEVTILRHIHGADAVLSVTATGKSVKRTEAQERARLAALYRNGPEQAGEKLLAAIFGVAGALPLKIHAAEAAAAPEEFDETKDEVVEEKIERTSIPAAIQTSVDELTG